MQEKERVTVLAQNASNADFQATKSASESAASMSAVNHQLTSSSELGIHVRDEFFGLRVNGLRKIEDSQK